MMYSKKNISTGIIYFFVHFIVELISFAILSTKFGLTQVFFTAMLFDFLAFVPQGLLGSFYETHKKVKFRQIGMAMLIIALIMCNIEDTVIFNIGIAILGIGNAILRECGAIDTVANSESKIFSSALFVGGGSFGLCLGKMYHYFNISILWLLIPLVIGFILLALADKLRPEEFTNENYEYPKFRVVKQNIIPFVILLVVFITTTIRGFVAYAIPTSWCDEVWEICLLYIFMGTGKAFGGFACDKWGMKNVSIVATLGAIPFLICGDQYMIVSVIGVFMFSMTMSISFAMGIDVLKNSAALAFGITTIGLIFGAFINYVWTLNGVPAMIFIAVTSIICSLIFAFTLDKSKA